MNRKELSVPPMMFVTSALHIVPQRDGPPQSYLHI